MDASVKKTTYSENQIFLYVSESLASLVALIYFQYIVTRIASIGYAFKDVVIVIVSGDISVDVLLGSVAHVSEVFAPTVDLQYFCC